MGEFSENTRVKIPALVHITRLGYDYLSLKDNKLQIDPGTNIFKRIFRNSLNQINNMDLKDEDIEKIIQELNLVLENEDLGKSFYKILLNGYKGIKLIDYENPQNNQFNVVTELPYENGEDSFRPDIIILINGMPLSFIEVKKPNNREGILAERNRINYRFRNSKFIKFVNITQLLVFSNNMEYNEDSVVPIEGAFYATPSYQNVFFNCFREENENIFNEIDDISIDKEKEILKDNNYVTIKGTPEYFTNLKPISPTNRIITSLFHKERIINLLKYGIAYVEKTDRNGIVVIQKHIMRYQQLFATMSIKQKIDENIKKGIIWHTQGSGKTALAYYNVKFLTDYFHKKNIVAKFYFIVDRLDLLNQASKEFTARGLKVAKVNSKDEFVKNIKQIGESNSFGEPTINVVNIQKFSEESFVKQSDYNVNVQRIYFLDEAHRSYDPKGSFLSNLLSSDRDSIIIALTGTPLIGRNSKGLKFNSKDIFGDYIHKYYYNKSIADGYTLKLIREGIETSYRVRLQNTVEEIKKLLGPNNEEQIYSSDKYTSALADYIAKDFNDSRIRFNDDSIGAMIVCDSQAQARSLFEQLDNYNFSKALILHNENNKQIRTEEVEEFKKGNIDILVVQNMLLTGFDAPRLKKIYLGRVIKAHNLLQTLTRVNRPYKNFRYGYVVDFADIREEFDKTNAIYFKELQEQLGDEFNSYSNIFLSEDEINKNITELKQKLFTYNTDNLEEFTNQINQLPKKELTDLKKSMTSYKELYNIIKAFNYKDLIEKIEINKIEKLLNEVERRIAIINLTSSENNVDNTELLNVELDKINFQFKKIGEEELVIADKYRKLLEDVRKEFVKNIDKDDISYLNLWKEFESMFRNNNLENLTATEMEKNIEKLTNLKEKAHQLNVLNERYTSKYFGDEKFVRIHKRSINKFDKIDEIELYNILLNIKEEVDNIILKRVDILDSEAFFKKTIIPIIIKEWKKHNLDVDVEKIEKFTTIILDGYINERRKIYE